MNAHPQSSHPGVDPVPSTAPKAMRPPLRSGIGKWVAAFAVVFIFGLIALASLIVVASQVGPGGALVGFIIATLPVPMYVLLAIWLDRFEVEPLHMMALAFAWGATGAIMISFLFNTLNGLIIAAMFGPATSQILSGVLSAPFVEELSKALILFVIFLWKRDEFDGIVDGVIYAALVGLGFAMTENMLYYGRAVVTGGLAGLTLTFVVRGVISPFAHSLFTSMTGIGLGIARQSNELIAKCAPLAGLVLAMVGHMLWNGSFLVMAEPPWLWFITVYPGVMVPSFLGVLVLVYFSLRTEGAIVRLGLAPEAEKGAVELDDYDQLCTISGRIHAGLRALSRGGPRALWTRWRFHQIASELAFHRHRVASGKCPEDPEREAAYANRLAALYALVTSK